MRVLQINPYPPEHFGGSEIFCKNLAIQLKKRKGVNSDILTSDIFNFKKKINVIDENIDVIYKKCYYNLWNKNPLVYIYSYLKKNYLKYDLIHTHSYIFFTSFQCSLLRKLREFPLILHIHGGIQTNIGIDTNFRENIQINFKKTIFDNLIGKFTIKNSDAIISVSNRDLIFLANKYNVPKEKLYYVPNAVDVEKFQNFKKERKYITFLGRLSYIKGIDRFIWLVQKLNRYNKNLKFLIVGDGPLRDLVYKAKKELPIIHIHQYPYNQIEKIYNNSKVIINTSRFEGLPTSFLESLACETPVITVNVGGTSELIKSHFNGLLLDYRYLNKEVRKILELIESDDKLKEFGKNGRQLIENKFSWKIVTDKIEKIYKTLKS